MKRKVVVITAVALLLAVATVAMANGAVQLAPIFSASDVSEDSTDIFEDATQPVYSEALEAEHYDNSLSEIVIFSDEAVNSVDVLDLYMKSNNFGEADSKLIKNKFITTVTTYRMTTDELDFVNSLIEEDYDIEVVLDIYEFLRWTNADITIIPTIYNAGMENSDKEFWIYDTYDQLFERKDDILTVEDVAYYVSFGISPNEIAGVYELSFAGKKSTKQMLNERLEGNSWNTIAATALSKTPEFIENADEMTIDDIMMFRKYSIRTRKDVAEISTIKNGKLTISYKTYSDDKDAQNIKEKLIIKYDAELPETQETISSRTSTYANTNSRTLTVRSEDTLFEDGLFEEETEAE